jgi:hypothetical protein
MRRVLWACAWVCLFVLFEAGGWMYRILDSLPFSSCGYIEALVLVEFSSYSSLIDNALL